MAKGDGKTLETLLGQSVDQFGPNRSTGSLSPLCDRVQVLSGGRLLLWECKEVGTRNSRASKGNTFQLTDMTENERNTMRDWTAGGALCVIVFAHQVSRTELAYWATTWPEWKAVEDAIGFIEVVTYTPGTTVKPRRKPGTSSVSMIAPGRPPCLRPILLNQRGRLDLSSFLAGVL